MSQLLENTSFVNKPEYFKLETLPALIENKIFFEQQNPLLHFESLPPNYSGISDVFLDNQFLIMDKFKWLKVLGSAILICVACIDPGNLEGDISGALQMRYKAIWVLLFTHILAYFIQEMSFILGVMSDQDLGQLIRQNYSKKMKFFLWISQELAIISADVQEVLGAIIGLQILVNIGDGFGIILVLTSVVLILFLQEVGQQIFEGFFGILIGILSVSMVVNFFSTDIEVEQFFKGFIPNLPDTSTLLSIMGSVIMPQNIFLHAALVQTRKHMDFTKNQFINIYRIETGFILVVSFIINMCLVGIFAGPQYIGKDITIKNAGQYLKQFLQESNQILWGLGLIASGISSTVTGALTGQYLMDGIFKLQFPRKIRILITRFITIIPCLIILKTADISDAINLLNIVQLVSLPFVAIPLLKFIQSSDIMKGYIYNKQKLILIYVLCIFLTLANYYSIIVIVKEYTVVSQVIFSLFLILYTAFCIYMMKLDIFNRNESDDIVEEIFIE